MRGALGKKAGRGGRRRDVRDCCRFFVWCCNFARSHGCLCYPIYRPIIRSYSFSFLLWFLNGALRTTAFLRRHRLAQLRRLVAQAGLTCNDRCWSRAHVPHTQYEIHHHHRTIESILSVSPEMQYVLTAVRIRSKAVSRLGHLNLNATLDAAGRHLSHPAPFPRLLEQRPSSSPVFISCSHLPSPEPESNRESG